jgi:hypothetical protein
VLISAQGRIKLADFGLSTVLGKSSALVHSLVGVSLLLTRLSATDMIEQTRGYLAPVSPVLSLGNGADKQGSSFHVAIWEESGYVQSWLHTFRALYL